MKSIIELAREAGLYVGTNLSGVVLVGAAKSNGLLIHMTDADLERFAHLIRAEVLEEAAGVCDEHAMKNEHACDGADEEDATSLRSAAWQMSVCAAAIRALKDKT